MALWQVIVGSERRLARGPADQGPVDLLDRGLSIDDILSGPRGALADVLRRPAVSPVPETAQVVVPLGAQEVWCAGVTYARSRDARVEESADEDVYERVYRAERPELFMKAAPGRTVGPDEAIYVRADSSWDVPEPELAAVANSAGDLVAWTIGNDVSSRSIEGENPLYLPQAKVFARSCAVGPCLVPLDEATAIDEMHIAMRVSREGTGVLAEQVSVRNLRRSPTDLLSWLYRAQEFPVGVVLLTGTALVPEPSFTLTEGDDVEIEITDLGLLRNPVSMLRTRA